jgi:hypothetical protein
VQHGADVESRDLMNNTPVFLAAFGGHAKVVQTLVQRDARIDVCNSDGCTPLHNAARSGSADTIKLLLRLGARADVEGLRGPHAVRVRARARPLAHRPPHRRLREQQRAVARAALAAHHAHHRSAGRRPTLS